MNLPCRAHVFLHDRPLTRRRIRPWTTRPLSAPTSPTTARDPGGRTWEPGGAVALIAFGAIATAWVFLRLPGTPQEPALGYHGAAKLIAIGLVTVGCTLMSRRRGRPAASKKTNEQEHI